MTEKFKNIPIGTKVEMKVVDPIDGKLDIAFISQIENYCDQNTLIMSAPIYESRIYPIRVNSKIEAYAYRSDHIYRILGFVEKRLIIDDIAVLEVKITEEIQRIQRRQFYRFKCSVPVTFYLQQSDEQQDEAEEIIGQTLNISGGGLAAITDKPLQKDYKIVGQLFMNNDNFINFNVKVIRCTANVINDKLKYISSIGFIDMGYKEREMIVNYIFDQQRILLNKGLR